MTCADQTATFRLLDPWVGWQPDGDATGLTGLTDEGGLRLDTVTGGLLRDDLLPWFGDPRLAAAGRTGWYRLQAGAGGPRLLRRDPCTGDWPAVWSPDCDPGLLREPVAVAAGGHWLAVVDSGRVLLWDREGEQLAAVIGFPEARLAAVGRSGELLAGGADGTVLWRFGPDGTPRGRVRTGADGRLLGIRVGRRRHHMAAHPGRRQRAGPAVDRTARRGVHCDRARPLWPRRCPPRIWWPPGPEGSACGCAGRTASRPRSAPTGPARR